MENREPRPVNTGVVVLVPTDRQLLVEDSNESRKTDLPRNTDSKAKALELFPFEPDSGHFNP